MRLLGVSERADARALGSARRATLRRVHPDVGGTDREAAQVNDAYDVLLRRTRSSPSGSPSEPAPADRAAVDAPIELLPDLVEAAHAIGDVVYVDTEEGLVGVVVDIGGHVGHLLAEVGVATVDGTPIAFTLDPVGPEPVPAIVDVVDRLLGALKDG
ncbi:MAG: J domain-containing protein [Acidimicrobiales bacterium]